jgi:hypothetical protein
MPQAADMLDVPYHSKRFTGLNGLITLNPSKPAKFNLAFIGASKYIQNGAAQCRATMGPFLDAVDAQQVPRSSLSLSLSFLSSPADAALLALSHSFLSSPAGAARELLLVRALPWRRGSVLPR